MEDPRGPFRTIKSTTLVHDCTLSAGGPQSCRHDTYEECEHVGHSNPTMSTKVGARSRCFACGPYGAAHNPHS